MPTRTTQIIKSKKRSFSNENTLFLPSHLLVNTPMPFPPASLPYPCLPALRHIAAPHRTTIKLEKQFWASIDHLAEKTGRTWSEWVATELTGKPVGIGAASWLRVRCLIHSTQGA